MLTMNVELQDRLISGQLGTVKHIAIINQRNISKIYMIYDDKFLREFPWTVFLVTVDGSLLREPNLTSELEQVKIPPQLLTEVSFDANLGV